MKLYNTLTKKIELVKPIQDKHINMFVCGPTVYDYSHIGHAKTYTQLDVLARVLKQSEYDVFYLQNITDIDDKIITRARGQGVDWQDLRAKYESAYFEDMKALNNNSVTKYARATDHINDIIRQVQTLLDKDYAYRIEDGIYFEIAKFEDYGKLSGRTEVKENDAETRIDQSDNKRGWNDFCLWKFARSGEPDWDAPFGAGRPGWHIEDTAISEYYFGPQYDLHGAAVDLIFPHHEAEITQMESASGKSPFVKHWVHVNFLNINSEKMSKSLGNFFTIRDVLGKGYDPMAIRLFMLQSHYRSAINFSWDNLYAAANRLVKYRALADLRFQVKDSSEITHYDTYKQKISHELQNDLNTPEALAQLSLLSDDVNESVDESSLHEFIDLLKFIDDSLGLQLLNSQDINNKQKHTIAEREKARQNKDFKKSDELREKLKQQGIEINDTQTGPIWSRL